MLSPRLWLLRRSHCERQHLFRSGIPFACFISGSLPRWYAPDRRVLTPIIWTLLPYLISNALPSPPPPLLAAAQAIRSSVRWALSTTSINKAVRSRRIRLEMLSAATPTLSLKVAAIRVYRYFPWFVFIPSFVWLQVQPLSVCFQFFFKTCYLVVYRALCFFLRLTFFLFILSAHCCRGWMYVCMCGYFALGTRIRSGSS